MLSECIYIHVVIIDLLSLWGESHSRVLSIFNYLYGKTYFRGFIFAICLIDPSELL